MLPETQMNDNERVFRTMLEHLGRKEFDACERCLAPDLYADWPYQPAPGTPIELHGARALMEYIAAGTADFDPYSYQVDQVYRLADPDTLIAEYGSFTRYRPTGREYANRYLGIFRFRDGLITYWREYVNPEIIRRAMQQDAE